MRVLTALLCTLMFLIAGCQGGEPVGSETPADADQPPSGHPEDPHHDMPPAPDGDLGAGPVFLFTVNAFNGSAPATFNFTIDGGNVTDFTWGLAFGDGNMTNGTGPASLNHTYVQAGNYTATFNATHDNRTQLAFQHLVVTAPPAGVFVKDEPKQFTGTMALALQVSPATPCNTGYKASASHAWTLSGVEEDGTATMIDRVHIKMSGSDTALDADVQFKGPDGTVLGEGTGPNSSEEFTVEGPLAPGDYTVHVIGCRSVNGSYTVNGVATYVTA